MRYKYSISSDELKDELREAYSDLVDLIGFRDSSGNLEYPGYYDYAEDQLEDIASGIIDLSAVNEHLLESQKNIIMMREEPDEPEIRI